MVETDDILDKLAFAMMTAELGRQTHKNLDDALRVSSEVRRTYRRLVASGEAQALLTTLGELGMTVAPLPTPEHKEPK